LKDFSILIVSYGDPWWRDLAISRALPSALTQGDNEIVMVHDPDPGISLSRLRNRAADMATSESLVFLDADDELEPGYIDAMRTLDSDVRVPMVRCLSEGPNETPLPESFEIAPRPFLEGNYIVIGAAIRRQLFYNVGGFDDYETAEDWPLWIKAWIARARIASVAGAIYRQHWRPGSRNQLEHKQYSAICDRIRNRYTPLARKAGLL